ncbi:MAG: GxxExxY protein [Syntrophobacteraceae bacterium]
MDTDEHGWRTGQVSAKVSFGEGEEYLTASIVGAGFEVGNILWHGFLEAVYRRALVHELSVRGLSVVHPCRRAFRKARDTDGHR